MSNEKVLNWLNQVKDAVEQTTGSELLAMLQDHNHRVEVGMFDNWYDESYGKLIEAGHSVTLLPSSLKQAYLQGCKDTRERYANEDALSKAINEPT